jgi:hypothetical protein
MNGFKVKLHTSDNKCWFFHKWKKWSENGVNYWKCEKCSARKISGDDAEKIDWDFLSR